ncbi:MAG: cyclic nucleotide-binding domain-containing protein [Chloroflexota bacterium]|nr:cyclic nucleotide-binding domain-containing protein [Chloroflexota bacterium]
MRGYFRGCGSPIRAYPPLAILTPKDRNNLITDALVFDIPEGATILWYGDTIDAVYFIPSGKTVAGFTPQGGNYRSLTTMGPGNFFVEIAALTGVARTADVVSTEATSMFQLPAQSLRNLMAKTA